MPNAEDQENYDVDECVMTKEKKQQKAINNTLTCNNDKLFYQRRWKPRRNKQREMKAEKTS